jgi:DNA helicase TIP49 (TBP-interacting protein)
MRFKEIYDDISMGDELRVETHSDIYEGDVVRMDRSEVEDKSVPGYKHHIYKYVVVISTDDENIRLEVETDDFPKRYVEYPKVDGQSVRSMTLL